MADILKLRMGGTTYHGLRVILGHWLLRGLSREIAELRCEAARERRLLQQRIDVLEAQLHAGSRAGSWGA